MNTNTETKTAAAFRIRFADGSCLRRQSLEWCRRYVAVLGHAEMIAGVEVLIEGEGWFEVDHAIVGL